ncbi:hypothetical protein B0H17DRAFT_866828, partial [Mycena rosella]
YWSLDPSGAQRLSTEEAENIGFPSVEFQMTAYTSWWYTHIYAGLRQFHEAKGFNPYGQDVALHLGYPLLQL